MKCINYELIEQYAKRLKDGDDPIEKAFEMYEYVGGIVFDGVPIDTVLEIIDDADKKAGDKTYIILDDGFFCSQARYIKEKVLELRGDKNV